MTITLWSEDMDRAIYAGFASGLSARQIAEELGKTRNAVLGRAFRLNINIERPARRAARPTPLKRKIKTSLPFSDDQIAERIADARDLGVTWRKLAIEFDVDMSTIRNWARKLGVFNESLRVRRFTAHDIEYIRTAWDDSVPVEDIASYLGRSFGVIRQMILRLQKSGEIGARDPAKTRLLKRYGAAALAAGETPTEALKKMAEAKTVAFASARAAATAAMKKRYEVAMTKMRAEIAAGVDRNAAIFAARAEGVTLERIAEEFGCTRERIRQICNSYAETLALRHLEASLRPREKGRVTGITNSAELHGGSVSTTT